MFQESPLILAPAEETRTITLGVQQFIGQYVTDWNSVLAALTLAIAPVLDERLKIGKVVERVPTDIVDQILIANGE